MTTYKQLIFDLFNSMLVAYLATKGEDQFSHYAVTFQHLLRCIETVDEAASNDDVLRFLTYKGVRSVDDPEFKTLINTKYHDQAFRALMVMRKGFPDDRRVWNYACNLPERYYKAGLGTTSFFMIVTTPCRQVGKEGFFTQVATPFERLIYIMAARMIADYHAHDSEGRTELTESPPGRRAASLS